MAVESYELARLVSEEASEYLARRGISEEAATGARAGVVEEPEPGHAKFKGMLAIPYLDKNNDPLTLRFRCMEDHDHRQHGHGKYMSLPHDPPRMYNVRAIHQAQGDSIHVCEGELDAVILGQLGLDAVAIPGAQSWQGYHRRMVAGFSKIWVWHDQDEAGVDLLNKITNALRQAKPVRLPGGLDVSDAYLEYGGDYLLDLIRDGKKAA